MSGPSPVERRGRALFAAFLVALLQPSAVAAVNFQKDIRPALRQFCLECHSTEKHKGDLDLERFASLADARKSPKIWQGVAEQLALNEMPPKDHPQPTPAQRKKLLGSVNAMLDGIALAQAGDPGPVVFRRLSNAEYTYTLRDLTGVESLDPAREFPADGAAGEGFMNVGNALVMSPSLFTKYLDAGKSVAGHAVLLPDGIRFSPKATRRDWTDELLAQIREFYRQYTDPRGGDQVNLQGVIFETNEGGRIPLAKYLGASLQVRAARGDRNKAVESVAKEHGLSPRYLGQLVGALTTNSPSFLLDPIREEWRAAKPADLPALAAAIEQWQKPLWKFSSIGHIGRADGPKGWMEPATPISARQEVKLKLAAPKDGDTISLFLLAGDAGDGSAHDFTVWREPRFVAPGRADLLLRDVRAVNHILTQRRRAIFAQATNYLAAAAEAGAAPGPSNPADLAAKHGVEADALEGWLIYLGLGAGDPAKIDSHFKNVLNNASGYNFIKGWGNSETPLFVANSSTQQVRIPGTMAPHSVALHPSPTLQAAVGWRSPIAGKARVEARVIQAHPECGNGVTWSLELRRGGMRRRLASGVAQGGKEEKPPAIEALSLRPGDLISLFVGPRDGNHSCDLTSVDLAVTALGEGGRKWNLAADVSPNVLAGNPHADQFGNDAVWHFYTEPDKGGAEAGPVIPPGSILAQWESASDDTERAALASGLQTLLASAPPADKESPDARLHRQMSSLGGPLFAGLLKSATRAALTNSPAPGAAGDWSLDPALFGRHPAGSSIDPASLCVQSPSAIEIRLPAELVAGCEFVATGELDAQSGSEGSVQLQALAARPAPATNAPGALSNVPILVRDASDSRRRVESAMDQFRLLFPAALCYTKIVPVDEVITLTLFHREDHQLVRLMLDPDQAAQLDRLWDQLRYISRDAIALVDAYEQIAQYATQDAPEMVKALGPMRAPILANAEALRRRLVETEPHHLQAVLEFAEGAYRRPVSESEKESLRGLYQKLRAQELPHDDAIRLTLARILSSPAFLYHAETPGPGVGAVPVDDWELASRLSYFLWSTAPDAELRQAAATGKLRQPSVLAAQAKRMLRDPRMRRMAKEFATAWLHIYGFDELAEKSERHFPTFTALRGDMYEESIRFFADLFQRDGSVLEIIDADFTFLNESLAAHYGIPSVAGPEWRRVDGVRKYGRGGVLGQAATLSRQSGASRTSPILRGNWLSEALLGERLPRPPKDVPTLPEDEGALDLTVRQLTERHSSDPRCAGCHARIDAFGFSLEGFDAIGRKRDKDLAGHPINTSARTLDGAEFDGVDGLRDYLLTQRRDAFVKQFCRKLLGYSLGRAVQLSDEPLLAEMRKKLKSNKHRVGAAINVIVRSPQFREIRGRDTPSDE